jgi:putative NADH-flavin reductase
MTKIAVLGANGKAGRRIVAEAARRGHHVTAVVRDPVAYAGPTGDRIVVVPGDVTDRATVGAAVSGVEVVVSAVSSMEAPEAYFPAVASVLGDVVPRGARLVLVGIGTILRLPTGVALFESPAFPEAGRGFSLGHAAELEVLGQTGLDWLVVAPPPVFLADDEASGGGYCTSDGTLIDADQPFSYGDLSSVIVDEIERPQHHRMLLAVARTPASQAAGGAPDAPPG